MKIPVLEDFILLGHDCPLGRYPGPVVPIGRKGNREFAIYSRIEEQSGIHWENLDSDLPITRYSVDLREKLEPFDPTKERLFAFSPTQVWKYTLSQEATFFSEVLRDPIVEQANSFIRLSLAKRTGDHDLVIRELAACWRRLHTAAPKAADFWYDSERRILSKSLKDPIVPVLHNLGRETKHSVLIVEDDRRICEVLVDALDHEGFEVLVAKDGLAGLETARTSKPDLILLDVMLPEMNGFEMCREVKSDAMLFDTPVIILSALGDEEDLRQSREVGANYHFSKPYERGELIATVRELVAAASA